MPVRRFICLRANGSISGTEPRTKAAGPLPTIAVIDKVPILVKAGAIIPMGPDNQHFVDEKTGPLTIRIYPKGTSTFRLYEDDGVTYDYEKGLYATRMFKCVEKDGTLTVTKSAPRGKYKVAGRDHRFEIHKKMPVKSVTKDANLLTHITNKTKFDSATHGWFYDANNNIILAKVKGGANEAISLTFSSAAAGP